MTIPAFDDTRVTIPASDDSLRVPASRCLAPAPALRFTASSSQPRRSLFVFVARVAAVLLYSGRARAGVAHHCALWLSAFTAGMLRVVTWLLLARGEAPQQADVSAVDQQPGARCRNLALFGAQPPHGRVPGACRRLLVGLVGRLVRVLSFPAAVLRMRRAHGQ